MYTEETPKCYLYRGTVTYTEETEPLSIQEEGVPLRIQGKGYRYLYRRNYEPLCIQGKAEPLPIQGKTEPLRIQGVPSCIQRRLKCHVYRGYSYVYRGTLTYTEDNN